MFAKSSSKKGAANGKVARTSQLESLGSRERMLRNGKRFEHGKSGETRKGTKEGSVCRMQNPIDFNQGILFPLEKRESRREW